MSKGHFGQLVREIPLHVLPDLKVYTGAVNMALLVAISSICIESTHLREVKGPQQQKVKVIAMFLYCIKTIKRAHKLPGQRVNSLY